MNDSYVDTIEKLQAQGLEALKQAQAAQAAAVNSFRDLFTNATGNCPARRSSRTSRPSCRRSAS